jgi:phosphate transport system substrate-binding protein
MNPSRRRLVTAFSIAMIVTTATGVVGAQDVIGSTGIRGAGSTFAYPLLSKWSREYRSAGSRGNFAIAGGGLDDPSSSTALDYEPIGSLAGTLRVKQRAVDFAASEVPLSSTELRKAELVQFPMVIGGVVAVVNLPGVAPGELKLTGRVLADIYLGRITQWSDRAILALNPGLTLPDAKIAVIHRSDGSGTTFNFTHYLDKVSPEWRASVGADPTGKWPVGTGIKGNEAVARTVKATSNSIGYVEYAQALQSGSSYAQLQNRAGHFITPSVAGFQAAAADAQWDAASDFHMLLTDGSGERAYPIVATVFILMPKNASPYATDAVLDFMQWSLDRGGEHATELGYVVLPASLIARIKEYWRRNLRAAVLTMPLPEAVLRPAGCVKASDGVRRSLA